MVNHFCKLRVLLVHLCNSRAQVSILVFTLVDIRSDMQQRVLAYAKEEALEMMD